MERKHSITIAILLIQLIKTSVALQCYECTYNKVDSSVGILDTILKAFEKISDEHCKLEKEEDYRTIAVKNCPKPKMDHVYKCAELRGTVKTNFGPVSVDYWTVERGCVEVRVDDPETTDACHTDLPANGVARNLLSKTFSGLNFGDISFDGRTCYTQKTVSVPGLQCIKCTWNEVETTNPFVNTAISTLKKLSSQNCKLQNIEVDKYEVDLRNCPAPKKGYITKCGTIEGTIRAKFDFIAEWGVKYKTTQRDCIEVSEDAYAYSDGCHSDLPGNGPGRALLMETFAGLDLGDIVFDGKACYEQVPDLRVASPQTAAATTAQISSVMLTGCVALITSMLHV